jgi:hypothetical protein
VVVTGGAFSLVGAASPAPADEPVSLPVMPLAQAAAAEATGDLVVRPAIEPVDPEADIVDAGDLVKAVQRAEAEIARIAEEQRAAAEERAAEERAARARAEAEERARTEALGGDCGLDTSGLGRVKAHVLDAAKALGCRFGEPDMHGVAGRAGTSDHPSGLAVDFMVDRATGDALASCALENMEALGIKYVIWEQRINHGNGWRLMEDRGGETANHFDHVHVSFETGRGSGDLKGC